MPDTKTLSQTLENAVAVAIDDAGDLKDALLGKLCWFQISNELRVAPDRLAEYFEYFSIEETYLPKPIEPRAVVKSVLTKHPKAPGRDKLWLIGDHKWELKFWAEIKNDGSIEAPLVRRRRRSIEERNRGMGEWETVTVATAVWDPKHEPIIEALGFKVHEGFDAEYPYAEIFSAIDEEYIDQLRHFTGGHVHHSIKQILTATSSVPIRQAGGIWVIPPDAIDLLDRVEKLIDSLIAPPLDENGEPVPGYDDGGKTQFVSVPLADGNKQRLVIRGAVETKILKDLSAAITRLNELRKTGLPARPSELAEATDIRRKAFEVGKHYHTVATSDLAKVKRMLGDFDALFAAAMTGESDDIELESLKLVEEDPETEMDAETEMDPETEY